MTSPDTARESGFADDHTRCHSTDPGVYEGMQMTNDQLEKFSYLFISKLQRDYGDLLTEMTLDDIADLAVISMIDVCS